MATEIVLYSRKNCRLCDVAEKVLQLELSKRGLSYRKVDVDSELDLCIRFGDDVPVIAIDGEPRFKHSLNAKALDDYLNLVGDP